MIAGKIERNAKEMNLKNDRSNSACDFQLPICVMPVVFIFALPLVIIIYRKLSQIGWVAGSKEEEL